MALVSAGLSVNTIVGCATASPEPAHAWAPTTATTTAETVRRSAANIPGYGPADVLFPPAWQEARKMRREIIAGKNSNDESTVIEYAVRFLPSALDDAVIADRGFNQANMEAALAGGGSSGSRVQSLTWTTTNPNDLQIVYVDGTRKEIKVTKRATERTDSTVSSSEYLRVTTTRGDDAARGIPVISAQRVLTKWRAIENGVVEGIELVYDVDSGAAGDPMSPAVLPSLYESKLTLVSKSRLRLER